RHRRRSLARGTPGQLPDLTPRVDCRRRSEADPAQRRATPRRRRLAPRLAHHRRGLSTPMPLDLLELGSQVRQMGELLTARRAAEQRRIELLEVMLAEYGDRWEELADLAETVQERVAVPTGPLDERVPPTERPQAYTAMATDGAEIDPDRHGGSGDFYLINVGRVRIPYGQPTRDVELRSVSKLGYTDEDLFIVDPRDPRRQVPMRDRHLDALRTVEELRALADLAQSEIT